MGKLEEYKESAGSTSKAIPEIVSLTFSCWILKGFEWWFLGYALGIHIRSWLAFFLIHPLVTALAFIPITPAGIGVQEFGIVGILGLFRSCRSNSRRIRIACPRSTILKTSQESSNRKIHKPNFFTQKAYGNNRAYP